MTPRNRTVLFVGPHAAGWAEHFAAANRLGLPVAARAAAVEDVTAEMLFAAGTVVVERAVEPAFRERFPDAECEVWPDPTDLPAAMSGLIARLLGGTAGGPPEPPAARPKPANRPVVKVGWETAGRRGKGVTVISEVPLDEAGLKELAAALKEKCGTGGTAKDGRIELQGDHRDRVIAELDRLGYRAKRAGG